MKQWIWWMFIIWNSWIPELFGKKSNGSRAYIPYLRDLWPAGTSRRSLPARSVTGACRLHWRQVDVVKTELKGLIQPSHDRSSLKSLVIMVNMILNIILNHQAPKASLDHKLGLNYEHNTGSSDGASEGKRLKQWLGDIISKYAKGVITFFDLVGCSTPLGISQATWNYNLKKSSMGKRGWFFVLPRRF